MKRSLSLGLLGVVASLAIFAVIPVYGGGQEGGPSGTIVPGQFLVLVNDGASPSTVAKRHGAAPRHIFGAALNGFSGPLSPEQVTDLTNDFDVRIVQPDSIQNLLDQPVPKGIDRTEADKNPNANNVTVDLDVAIIDGGIYAKHPDLNVGGGRNFTSGPTSKWDDSGGHGTHVAGTVAAKDNAVGAVGVAPGARVWALKVCKNFCFTSDMIAAIDWATAQKIEAFNTGGASGINFAVANMSISTPDDATDCNGGSDALHAAICGLVGSGVVFTLAAGNDNRQKDAYPEVLAVSALADFDGKGGGAGSSTCRTDEDDTLANFSNYGPSIDIAAPGTCILSTWNDGGTNTISGTSMAAPHVAGAVALYLHANNKAPATNIAEVNYIETAILGAALQNACGYTNEHAAQGSAEPLLFVNSIAEFGGNGDCDVDAPTPDSTPPSLASAVVDGESLVLTYDEPLDTGSTPVIDDFSIGTDGAFQSVSFVAISGSVVTLSLTPGVGSGDSITVNYTAEPGLPIQDMAGNDAADLVYQPVSNATSDGLTDEYHVASTNFSVNQKGPWYNLTATMMITDFNGNPAPDDVVATGTISRDGATFNQSDLTQGGTVQFKLKTQIINTEYTVEVTGVDDGLGGSFDGITGEPCKIIIIDSNASFTEEIC